MIRNNIKINAMPTIRIRYRFVLFVTLFIVLGFQQDSVHVKSLSLNITQSAVCHLNISINRGVRFHSMFNKLERNVKFSKYFIGIVCCADVCLWFYVLVLNISGDIHPNPGPSTSSVSSNESLSDMSSYLSKTHYH